MKKTPRSTSAHDVESEPKVRIGSSHIDGTGVLVTRLIAPGEVLGRLDLGPPVEQGRHTVRLGGGHREVFAPWRFLNHSCAANAAIESGADDVVVVAVERMLPGTEITIDYRDLDEDDQAEFSCRCEACRGRSEVRRAGRRTGGASS